MNTDLMVKRVLITGITGTLGTALGQYYLEKGWYVLGVTRQNLNSHSACSEIVSNSQNCPEDAQSLLSFCPDLVYLNAGAIETEIGSMGEPLSHAVENLTKVNYMFPAIFALEAANQSKRKMEIICIGSIADGSPSCFGPLYHASKIALHYFIQGTAPILSSANPGITLKLYRPGAIYGPLSWAPVNRLNKKGVKIRTRRCESAPQASEVAEQIDSFRLSGKRIGTYDEPVSFRFLKIFFALFPNTYAKIQHLAWRKTSKFAINI